MIIFFCHFEVWDDGIEVTPLPLLQTDPNAVRQKQSNILGDSSQGTVSF